MKILSFLGHAPQRPDNYLRELDMRHEQQERRLQELKSDVEARRMRAEAEAERRFRERPW